jgi:hypothetical protein
VPECLKVKLASTVAVSVTVRHAHWQRSASGTVTPLSAPAGSDPARGRHHSVSWQRARPVEAERGGRLYHDRDAQPNPLAGPGHWQL